MTGSQTTSKVPRSTVTQKQKNSETDWTKIRAAEPYEWDGESDDDRPLTREEMLAGVETYRKKRGRPVGSSKESTTIRFDQDVLAAFRAEGPGWQTRINAALREWLTTRSLL